MQNIIKPYSQIGKYERSGMYQVKCLDCPLKCIVQREHFILDIKYIYRHLEEIMETPDIQTYTVIRRNNGNYRYSNIYRQLEVLMENPDIQTYIEHRIYLRYYNRHSGLHRNREETKAYYKGAIYIKVLKTDYT
jgi:hypothetical protein